MDFLQGFPIAIIDDDYDGKRAAGRGMRQLAVAIEKEGYRVVAGLSYEDAAIALRIPVGTVRSRLSRARTRLLELDLGNGHERETMQTTEGAVER